MKYNGLPIKIELKETTREPGIYTNIPSDNPKKVVVLEPRVTDTEELIDLINGFAAQNLMLSRGPQYIFENIRDFVIAVDLNAPVGQDENGREKHLIVACGSLHVLWKDIAEIRALAIHPAYQDLGLGRQIVDFLKQDAIALGIKHLFTFTLQEKFFSALGFKRQARDDLPPKVWGECSRCPKYYKCDEVGMVMELP